MLEIREFRNALMDNLKENLGEKYQIQDYDAMKLNHVEQLGISVTLENASIAPIIYVESMFEDYLKGKPLSELAEQCLILVKNSAGSDIQDIEISKITDWEKVKGEIKMKLINTKRNKKFLENLPSYSFLNLSLIFYLELKETADGIATTMVNTKLIQHFDVDLDTLYLQACSNMAGEYTIRSLSSVLGMEDDNGLFVLSNLQCINGATEIVLEETKEALVQRFNHRDLFILPSSLHELILLPVNEEFSAENLLKMVQEINSTEVDEKDFLADTVYRFHAATKEITIAAQGE